MKRRYRALIAIIAWIGYLILGGFVPTAYFMGLGFSPEQIFAVLIPAFFLLATATWGFVLITIEWVNTDEY